MAKFCVEPPSLGGISGGNSAGKKCSAGTKRESAAGDTMPVVPESIAKGLISAADAPQTVDDYTAEVRSRHVWRRVSRNLYQWRHE